MVKYCGYYITFQEVPNEVSLTFTISNCPYRCEGCHSPWLQKDLGDELTLEILSYLIKEYQGGITCVCFMGEGCDVESLNYLIGLAHEFGLKTCLYSGKDIGHDLRDFCNYTILDYIKTGSYQKELGGLSSPTTNQRIWKLTGFTDDGVAIYEDITSYFWRKKE